MFIGFAGKIFQQAEPKDLSDGKVFHVLYRYLPEFLKKAHDLAFTFKLISSHFILFNIVDKVQLYSRFFPKSFIDSYIGIFKDSKYLIVHKFNLVANVISRAITATATISMSTAERTRAIAIYFFVVGVVSIKDRVSLAVFGISRSILFNKFSTFYAFHKFLTFKVSHFNFIIPEGFQPTFLPSQPRGLRETVFCPTSVSHPKRQLQQSTIQDGCELFYDTIFQVVLSCFNFLTFNKRLIPFADRQMKIKVGVEVVSRRITVIVVVFIHHLRNIIKSFLRFFGVFLAIRNIVMIHLAMSFFLLFGFRKDIKRRRHQGNGNGLSAGVLVASYRKLTFRIPFFYGPAEFFRNLGGIPIAIAF